MSAKSLLPQQLRWAKDNPNKWEGLRGVATCGPCVAVLGPRSWSGQALSRVYGSTVIMVPVAGGYSFYTYESVIEKPRVSKQGRRSEYSSCLPRVAEFLQQPKQECCASSSCRVWVPTRQGAWRSRTACQCSQPWPLSAVPCQHSAGPGPRLGALQDPPHVFP